MSYDVQGVKRGRQPKSMHLWRQTVVQRRRWPSNRISGAILCLLGFFGIS